MITFKVATAICAALLGLSEMSIALARPTAGQAFAKEREPTYIPFDPPLQKKIRYRWEQSESEDGKVTTHWELFDLSFDDLDDGYSLTITDIDSGSNETDPLKLAIEKDLKDLSQKKASLRLDKGGVVTELRDESRYWNRIFDAFEKALSNGKDGKPLPPALREAVASLLTHIRELPPEARLQLLTQAITPALEFGDTEMTLGTPLHVDSEATVFGTTINTKVSISLTRIDGGSAFYSIVTTVPKDQAMVALRALLGQMNLVTAAENAKLDAEMRKMSYKQESRAEYQVDTRTGLTVNFNETEVIEVGVAGEPLHTITTINTRLKRMN